ncbi:MAG: sulfatase-like hydrolase/transferase, partial [Deltaproteobacteria bacterium]|nr:sulfatase-like hydrolase/transferase [Deltaproteobacteria bacterium]
AVALLLTAFGISIANASLFYNLYIRLHVALHLSSALIAVLALYLTADVLIRKPHRQASLILAAILIVTIGAGFYSWRTINPDTRAELILKSVTARSTIRTYEQYFPSDFSTIDLVYQTLESLDVESAFKKGQDQKTSKTRLRQKNRSDSSSLGLPKDLNVLLIINDTARADAFPPNQKNGKTVGSTEDTPFLNKWIKKTTRFRSAYAQGAGTIASMPYLFRSINSMSDPLTTGVAPGGLFLNADKHTFAVVPASFQEAKSTADVYADMFRQFDNVDFYPNHAQQQMVTDTISAIRQLKGKPFVGWLQTYALHPPWFADNRLQKHCGEASGKQCYKKALKWVDSSIERLLDRLDAMHILERTVVIIASDHGTNLGDNHDDFHSGTVWEETIRVPLSIYVPGQKGGEVKSTVGNIDIIPTILDLIGSQPHPLHRGTSLVPFIGHPKTPWDKTYFSRSLDGNLVAVIKNRQKLIHDVSGNVFFKYDLRTDPKENHNQFNVKNKTDQQLLQALLLSQPANFANFLKNPFLQNLLQSKLARMHAKSDPANLDLLLTLAAHDPSKKSWNVVKDVYSKSKDAPFQLLVAYRMFESDSRYWKAQLTQLLENAAGTGAEMPLVTEMANLGVPAFSQTLVAARMGEWINKRPEKRWLPWLGLIYPWKNKSGKSFAPLIETILANYCDPSSSRCESTSPIRLDTVSLRQTLEILADLKFPKTYDRKNLEREALAFLSAENQSVQAAAAASLGNVGSSTSISRLKAIAERRSAGLPVRKASVKSIYAIEKTASLDYLIEKVTDPNLTTELIALISKSKYKKALPYLTKIAKSHKRPYTRSKAKNAIKKLSDKS